MPAVVKRLGHNANPAGTAARTASPGLRNQRLPGSLNPAERYAHGMRNGGDRVPGGSTGRRHRAADPERPPRIGATGGASLFTPAYRASHPSAGPYPGDNGPTGAGLADSGGPTRSASGYGWPATEQEPESVWAADDQPDGDYGWTEPGNAPAGYDQAADLPGGGYSWATDDLTNAGYSWYRDDLDGARPVPERPISNAVRGFPPAPGEPLPTYPPGPFAAWNRSASADDRGHVSAQAPVTGYADSSGQAAVATITPDEFDTNHSIPAIKDPVLGSPERARTGTSTRHASASSPGAARTSGAARPSGSARPSSSARSPGSTRSPGSRSPGSTRSPDAARAPGATRGRASGSHGGRALHAESGRAGAHARQQPVRLAIGAAIVIIAAVTAVLVIPSLGSSPSASHPKATGSPRTTPSPVVQTPTPPPGPWLFIGARTTDPVPLTMQELYPLSFIDAGVYYGRTVSAKSTNCTAAIIGSALQAAVQQAGCTQVLRATYLARHIGSMATIGVLNLKSFAAATKAAGAAGRSDFIAQLPANTGPTHLIGNGTGIEVPLVKGHYLILVWAEFIKLHAPRTKIQRQELSTFMQVLVQQTVNGSLSTRMVDGKPSPPG